MKSLLAPVVLVLMLSGSAQAQSHSLPVDPAEAEFQAAVTRYLALHDRLKSEVPPLAVTVDEAAISRASDMMAAAVQRARRNARRGEIFNDGVVTLITVRLRDELAGQDINKFLASITDEPNRADRPDIHKRYPAASSMATTPTRVLAVLPRIPDALEYRFMGRALVLRDRDAALIVDYIEDVFPAR